MGDIYVGTASWTDKSLLASGWYPREVKTAADRLAYYAEHFRLVEVDSTYYFPPSEENSVRWVERTPKDFIFNIKAYSVLTQHPTKSESIYKDLDVGTDKARVYPKDLDPKVIDEVWDRFLSALEPLRTAGKLGALLFQFPPWFTIARKNREYILECAKRAAPLQILVEFRHESWLKDSNREETLEFLEGHGLPYVCVDMPQGFKSSVPPVVAATADLAAIRFHGHNAEEWESGSVQRRFKYLYSKEELKEWAPRVAGLAAEAKSTHVLMNNCHADYAQRNARELAELLG